MHDEDDDDDEFGVSISAGCCLGAISLLIGNDIMEPVLAFVSQHMQNPNWKARYSALLALGAITEGPDRQKFMSVIKPGLVGLVGMFQDPSPKVREAISWVMAKICENHSDVVTEPRILNDFVAILLKSLQDKPKVSIQICRAIDNLAKSTAVIKKGQEQNALSSHFQSLVKALMDNAQRTDAEQHSNQLLSCSFGALHTLCESSGSQSDQTLYELLVPTL